MNRVIVRVKGGLGNQLFCYAAARRLALANGAELVIDDVTGFDRDRDYRRIFELDHFSIHGRKATAAERLEPFERYRRTLKMFVARRKPFEQRRYIVQEGIEFDRRLLDVKINGTTYLDGLWQGEGYFKDVEDVIRRDLEVDAPIDPLSQRIAASIRQTNSVALHVRWFDRPGQVGGYNVPQDYYTRAIQLMEQRSPRPHYFVYSDDPKAAAAILPLPKGRYSFVMHNSAKTAYADLWLMSESRHFIIANSTFSWWAAWLGRAEGKIVISPRIKLQGKAAWGFDGLIPTAWIEV